MWTKLASVIIFASISACVAQDSAEDLPKYTSRYDYLDLDSILDSRRLVKNYVDCLLNVRPCSPEGKALRRILPEALRTKCGRCTEIQRRKAVRVIRRLKSEYPEEWEKLSNRWDPTRDFNRYFDEVVSTNVDLYGPPEPSKVTEADPVVIITQSTSSAPSPVSKPSLPNLSNRFGDEDEGVNPAPNNDGQQSTIKSILVVPSMRPYPIPTGILPVIPPTRFTIIPKPASNLPPIYASTVTLIDHFGTKLIRTTEIVADIMLNSVRAFLGR